MGAWWVGGANGGKWVAWANLDVCVYRRLCRSYIDRSFDVAFILHIINNSILMVVLLYLTTLQIYIYSSSDI